MSSKVTCEGESESVRVNPKVESWMGLGASMFVRLQTCESEFKLPWRKAGLVKLSRRSCRFEPVNCQ